MTNARAPKRSIKLDGRQTSISLEDEFFEELRLIAGRLGKPVYRLIHELHETNRAPNFTAFLRLYVLADVQRRANPPAPHLSPDINPLTGFVQ
jgi:predicted DNA-binding ribbon-helix-helix protein